MNRIWDRSWNYQLEDKPPVIRLKELPRDKNLGWVVKLNTPGEIVDPKERSYWETEAMTLWANDIIPKPLPDQYLFEALHDQSGNAVRASTIRILRAKVWKWEDYREVRRQAPEYDGIALPVVLMEDVETGRPVAVRKATVAVYTRREGEG